MKTKLSTTVEKWTITNFQISNKSWTPSMTKSSPETISSRITPRGRISQLSQTWNWVWMLVLRVYTSPVSPDLLKKVVSSKDNQNLKFIKAKNNFSQEPQKMIFSTNYMISLWWTNMTPKGNAPHLHLCSLWPLPKWLITTLRSLMSLDSSTAANWINLRIEIKGCISIKINSKNQLWTRLTNTT